MAAGVQARRRKGTKKPSSEKKSSPKRPRKASPERRGKKKKPEASETATAVREFSHVHMFTALRGVQSGREFYLAMCPLKLLPKIFVFDEDDLAPELRAQRTLNRARVPEIARYVVSNPKDYVFSAITASIDVDVVFEPSGEEGAARDLGKLIVPMSARFLINDGQHRRAGIEEALKERPEIRDETIGVVFYIDAGLKRAQQMFADLNTHAIRPTKSLGVLYDHRDPSAVLARTLVQKVPCFRGRTELEKSAISNRSVKLFTLSSIYQATRHLLGKKKREDISPDEERIAIDYWTEVSKHMRDWELVRQSKASPAELRRECIHAHGLALHALSVVGRAILALDPKAWEQTLAPLQDVDWLRSNTAIWEGRATSAGRISKAKTHIVLTANYLKSVLGLPLTPEEQQLEDQYLELKGGQTCE